MLGFCQLSCTRLGWCEQLHGRNAMQCLRSDLLLMDEGSGLLIPKGILNCPCVHLDPLYALCIEVSFVDGLYLRAG